MRNKTSRLWAQLSRWSSTVPLRPLADIYHPPEWGGRAQPRKEGVRNEVFFWRFVYISRDKFLIFQIPRRNRERKEKRNRGEGKKKGIKTCLAARCAAAFFLQVPKSRTDLDPTLLYISIRGTYSNLLRESKELTLGVQVCFPKLCPSAGRRFAVQQTCGFAM